MYILWIMMMVWASLFPPISTETIVQHSKIINFKFLLKFRLELLQVADVGCQDDKTIDIEYQATKTHL